MSSLDKLLGLAGMGSTIANVTLLKRLLSQVIIIVALTAISSLMTGAILIAGFYGLYLALLHYGTDPTAAIFITVGMALALTAAVAGFAVFRWRQMHEASHETGGASLGRIGQIADAFIDGLLTGGKR